jgi:hypothetical protein
MKQAILCSVFATVCCVTFARNNSHSFILNTQQTPGDTVMSQLPAMEDLLQEITNVMDLNGRFILEEADVLNLEASISHKKKYIRYNSDFITWISDVTHDKWAAIALLAHEIGHHINGHTRTKGGSRPNLELEADEFAGTVLRKLGATLEESQEVMYYIAATRSSKTHPDRRSRMLAIKKGWERVN